MKKKLGKKSGIGYANPPPEYQFKEGNKDGGRTKGSLNKKTIFLTALTEVAEALKFGKKPDKIKIELVKRGIREGLAGNYPFWVAIMKNLGLSEDEKVKIEQEINIDDKQFENLIRRIGDKFGDKGGGEKRIG